MNSTNYDRTEAARMLFNEGWTGKRIATAFKVTEKTVSGWRISGLWDKRRAEQSFARETAEEHLWELINYQLAAIKKMKDDWIKEGTPHKLISRGDIDALQKMFVAVKGKQIAWTQYVSIMRDFMNYLQTEKLEVAKDLIETVDAFLVQKRKDL